MDAESFYFLNPGEFEQVYMRWSEMRDADLRTSWEQTRQKCYWSVYKLKTVMTMKNFMPLAWDKDAGKIRKVKDPERFEMLKQKYGEREKV